MSVSKMVQEFTAQSGSMMTVNEDTVPVIDFQISDVYSTTQEEVVLAVNFVRGGCKAVQLFGVGEKDDPCWLQSKQAICEQFAALEMPDEVLEVQSNDATHVVLVKRQKK